MLHLILGFRLNWVLPNTMPLENATSIPQLEPSYPAATDPLSQADDHLRLIKTVLRYTFPNLSAPVTVTSDQVNSIPSLLPVGLICVWYGTASTVPSGWHICDGSTVSLSDGSGGTVTLPNLTDMVVVGAGGSIAAQGATAGSATNVLTSDPAGSHSHTVSGGDHSHTGTVSGVTLTQDQIPGHRHYVANSGDSGQAYGTIYSNANGSINPGGAGGSSGASYFLGANSGLDATLGRTSSTGGGNSHDHPLTINSASHVHTVDTASNHQHTITVPTIQPSYGLYFIMKV